MGTPVHAIQVESLFFLNKETKSSLEMPNVKLTYFNLRGRGEPCRIMLAYGGIKYEDEIVDVIQDLTNTFIKFYFAKDEAALKNFSEVTLVTALVQLEKRLVSRGGEYFVGNSLTWADTHVFMYISDLEPAALEKFPKLTALKERVGNVPNIKAWVESRPKTDL